MTVYLNESLWATLSWGLKFIVSGKILVKETEAPLLGLAKINTYWEVLLSLEVKHWTESVRFILQKA